MPIEDIRLNNPTYEELAKAYGDVVRDYNLLEIDRELAENRVLEAENEAMGERERKKIFFDRLRQTESQIRLLEQNRNITALEIKDNLRNILGNSLRID